MSVLNSCNSGKRVPESTSRHSKFLLFAGLFLYIVGAALLAFAPYHWPLIALRCFGLVLLVFAGLQNRSLTFWIFFAMLAGLELGLDAPAYASQLRVFSDIFLRLIKVIVAPLILGTLITGIAGHGDLRKVGRIGWESLVYFEVVTTIALFLGVAAINLTKAGEGLVISAGTTAATAQTPPNPTPLRWTDFILHIFPENIVQSVADNQILQVAVFAILFAIALTRVPEAQQKPILNFAESLTQVMFRFTNIVMYVAPIGVGAAMAYTVGHMGIAVLVPLGKLLFTAYGALVAFLLFVLLPIPILP